MLLSAIESGLSVDASVSLNLSEFDSTFLTSQKVLIFKSIYSLSGSLNTLPNLF